MSVLKESEDILEAPFECKNEPKFDPCFGLFSQFEEVDDISGSTTCSICRKVIHEEFGIDEETWDEEDEAGDDSNEFVRRAGTRDLIGEDRKVHNYKDKVRELAKTIQEADLDFSLYMMSDDNLDNIVQRIRDLEEGGDPYFKEDTWTGVKIIAVATFLREKPPSEKIYDLLNFRQKIVTTRLDRLEEIYRPYKGSKEVDGMRNLFNYLNIPRSVLDYAIEEYETIRPINNQPNNLAKAAAWLFLIAEKTNTDLQKKDLWLAGAPKLTTNKAIASYRKNLQKLKGQIEDVDDTDDTDME